MHLSENPPEVIKLSVFKILGGKNDNHQIIKNN